MARGKGIFRFGTNEDLLCLSSSNIPIGKGGDLACYAAKIKTDWLVLPWRKQVDSYVLAVGDQYYQLRPGDISLIKQAGLLQGAPPKYAFSTIEKIWGHSLEIVVGTLLLCLLMYKVLPKKAQKKLDEILKAPSLSESDVMSSLATNFYPLASECALSTTKVLIIDATHCAPFRAVDVAELSTQLAMPGYPDEEIDAQQLEEVSRLKKECHRRTIDCARSPYQNPFAILAIHITPGEKPRPRVISLERKSVNG